MMRPPESGGRGPSSAGELDDAEIEPKRGKPDMPADPSTDQRTDLPTGERPTPGSDPAEGGPDNRLPGADLPGADHGSGLPGADRGSGLPGAEDDNLPERLGERIENGSSSAIAPGGSDVLPDVEPPETTM